MKAKTFSLNNIIHQGPKDAPRTEGVRYVKN